MSSQSSASKNSGVSYGSANKIICIRPGNYLTNSSAYRAIKRHSRPPDADAISPLSFLFSLLLSRRCLDISWRHATAEPFLTYVSTYTCICICPLSCSLFSLPVQYAALQDAPCVRASGASLIRILRQLYDIYNPLEKTIAVISPRNLPDARSQSVTDYLRLRRVVRDEL